MAQIIREDEAWPRQEIMKNDMPMPRNTTFEMTAHT